jgi:hypothetical protein
MCDTIRKSANYYGRPGRKHRPTKQAAAKAAFFKRKERKDSKTGSKDN